MRQLLSLIVTSAIILSASTSKAQWKLIEKVTTQPGKASIAYEKWELESNGLILYIHEDHSDPIVHVDVTYHVGSNRESLGKSGFAHFFEHMMFQGSYNVGDEMHFKYISEAGGTLNGTTNRDRTNYFETLPSNQLELGLWLEADRMGFLLDSVTTPKFEVQRSTVKNEKGQNVENQPYGLSEEVKDQNLYPQGHPYSWPTIGYVDDLDRVSVDDLKNFFMRWYGPNNASLTVVGDVDPEEVKSLAYKYYGNIPRGPEVRKLRVERVTLPIDRYINIKDQVFFPLTSMVFPSTPSLSKDEYAVDFLATLLGDGNNSLLYKEFVKKDSAIQVVAYNYASELSGEFTIQVYAYPNVNSKTVEEKIRKVLDDFDKMEITDEQLQALKAKTLKGVTSFTETVSNKATLIATGHYLQDKPFDFQVEIDKINAVTKQDIKMAFAKYIKGKNAIIMNVLPYGPDEKAPANRSNNPNKNVKSNDEAVYANLSYKRPVDNFDRSKKPQAKAPKLVTVPDYYEASLPNGVGIIGTFTNETPIVTFVLSIKGGHMLETESNVGLSALTAAMMNEGTKKYTAEQLEFELDKLGSSITFFGGSDATLVNVSCMNDKVNETMAILEEMLYNPRFDEEEFKKVKKQTLQAIKSEKTNASGTADKVLNNLVYGNSIMGLPVNGTEKSVGSLSLKDVRDFYEKYYSPSVSSLVIVGDIKKEASLTSIDFLKKWSAKSVVIPNITSAPAHPTPTIYLVDKMNASQSEIRLGKIGRKYDATGDHFKSNVMNFSLGGAFNSRLNINIRETNGWSYGVRSGFSASEFPGKFSAGGGVRRSATDSALREFLKEIKDFRDKGISDDELTFTKASILSSDARNYEAGFQKASYLSTIQRYKLPGDYKDQQKRIITNMTKEEINAIAKRDLDPANMVVVVVGDKFFIKKSLEKMGYGKVVEVDSDKPLKLPSTLELK